MKKRLYLTIITACIICVIFASSIFATDPVPEDSIWDGSVATSFSSGIGTAEDPYVINEASELAFFAHSVSQGSDYSGQYVSLKVDIDLNNIEWEPIGLYETGFSGTFIGNDHLISNLKITTISYVTFPYGHEDHNIIGCAGLFGYVSEQGCIADITVDGNIQILHSNAPDKECDCVGGIAGMVQGTMRNCNNYCNVELYCDSQGGYKNVGGICGVISHVDSLIDSCANYGDISATGWEARVAACGDCDGYSTIINTLNAGDIVQVSLGHSGYAGGVVAHGWSMKVANCYNIGSVSGYRNVGGITATVQGDSDSDPSPQKGAILNCYSCGSVEAQNSTACAIVPRIYNSSVTNCYWSSECSNDSRNTDSVYENNYPYYSKDELADLLNTWVQNDSTGIYKYWDENALGIVDFTDVSSAVGAEPIVNVDFEIQYPVDLIYDGTSKQVGILKINPELSDYTVTYYDTNDDVVSNVINPGVYHGIIIFDRNSVYRAASIPLEEFEILKGYRTASASDSAIILCPGDLSKKIFINITPAAITSSEVLFTYTSDNPEIASVDDDGTLQANSNGITNISIEVSESDYYVLATCPAIVKSIKQPITSTAVLSETDITINVNDYNISLTGQVDSSAEVDISLVLADGSQENLTLAIDEIGKIVTRDIVIMDELFTFTIDSTAITTGAPDDSGSTPPANPGNTGGGGGAGIGSTDVLPEPSIKVDKPSNGTLLISDEFAKAGDIVTVQIIPDNGFKIDTIKVINKNGVEVDLYSIEENLYSFEAQKVDITIMATFVKSLPAVNFTDVSQNQYYYNAVNWAVSKGITSGIAADRFGPNEKCTRAQIMTFLWVNAGCPDPTIVENPFKDVNMSDYYYKAVLWAVEQKITSGVSLDTFGANSECTRGQAVTFMYAVAGSSVVTDNHFSDVSANDYYFKPVLWASENGITAGVSKTEFAPNTTCTRAQIMTFMFNAFGEN